MKDLLTLAFVILIVFAIAGVSHAQAPSEAKAPAGGSVAKAKAGGPKVNRAVGEVAAVDPDGGTLRVKTKDAELLLTPGSKTARQSLQTLKVGDKIIVSYFQKEGYLVAPFITKSGPTTKPETTGKRETGSGTK